MGTNNTQPKIFACTNSRVLAEKITKSFGTKLVNIIISKVVAERNSVPLDSCDHGNNL